MAALHESLRLTLQEGISARAAAYAHHEAALRDAVTALGCKVTSDMTSLVVLNLPDELAGREMELVQACRAAGFGIWPTLSEPVQVRIGILNQLKPTAIREIVRRFAGAMRALGADADPAVADARLDEHYAGAVAAE
ncbi:hypothetical protein QW131_34380 [Roseibium salinum]|nr:hypothetical protein [Roseibium salinum]